MAELHDSNPAVAPVTAEHIAAALLEITQDLDKTQVLQQTLPTWWMDAEMTTRQALLEDHEHSQVPRERAARRLAKVKPLKAFCSERLTAFLTAKGHTALAVEHVMLEVPHKSVEFTDFSGLGVEVTTLEKHSLLQAAMQNFPLALAQPGAMPEGSLIRAGRSTVRTLSAETFVGYCRELDLGSAYQKHLREVFNLPAPDEALLESEGGFNPAVVEAGKSRCSDMQIDLHIACGKGHISQPTYVLLQALIKADAPVGEVKHLLFHGKPLVWQGLNIGGTCLWGIMVLANASTDGFSQGPVLLYMPNEPVRPWFEYPSLEDFKQYLTLKLQVQKYRQFFTGYLDESERFDFFQRFDQSRTLARLEPVVEAGNLSRFFFNSCTGKLLLDAYTLAVPAAQADEDARKLRLQNYLNIGMTVLNVAGFVVPVVGQLMMGVGIGQLLGEVFEGIDDWNHGEKTEALGHLVNVAESIASMALFAAGAHAVGAARRQLSSPADFFDGLEAVKLPDTRGRLWRRRLSTYRHTPQVVSSTVANSRGVYQVNGQSYVKVDGWLYSITFDASAKNWSVKHPLRSEAYRPPLNHNRAGGWQFDWERCHDWDDPAYIVTRLNPTLGAQQADQLKDIAAIADLSLPRLLYLAGENLPLPERFRDGVVRFRQEQKVRDLTWQLEHQERPEAGTGRTQMLALPHVPGWPKGRFFEVLDNEGTRLERYPETAPFDYDDLSIHITEQQLNDGNVMPTLLAALEADETRALLGADVEVGEAQATLTRRLLASLKHSHRQVHEQLYQEADVVTHADHGLLKAHTPRLPNRIAWELLSEASVTQRWRLRRTGRVPLLLAQRTREALQVLDEDQALGGLFWPQQVTEATQRLVVGLLPRMSGWPQALSLQVRRETLNGEIIAQLGDQAATLRRTVVASAEGFQAFDGQGNALGAIAMGGEGFYPALTDTLSTDQLAALRWSGAQRADYLRYALQDKVATERPTLTRYLWPERAVPEPPVACIQAARVEPAVQPATLMRKVAKLYPTWSPAQAASFLHSLGSDHLERAKAVQALEQQLKVLHKTLKQWRDDKASLQKLPHRIEDYRLSRQHSVKEIENSWKRVTLLTDDQNVKVPSLVLDGRVVGPLPRLPPEIDFSHVRQLSLRHMELNDDVAYFLKHFTGLESLDLQGNQVTRLPEVLSQMPQLRTLRLNDNKLQLTEYTRAKLAGLTELQVLNLNNNPLMNPPAIGRLFGLRTVLLNNCLLRDMPSGWQRLPYLETLDVRSNNITTLPQWLADVSRTNAQALNLRSNPLGTPSRLLLSHYRQRSGIGMGFLENDIARLTEQKAQELWLTDVGTDFLARQATWAALKDEPGCEGLFNLLAELGGSADANQVREDMRQRVWRVLQAAEADAALRAEVFERAATPFNCDDAAAASFSDLEVLTEVHEVSRAVEGGALTAKPLLRLGRGLFRLDQLERFAQQYSVEHPSADPLEVSLAFRTGLVDTFHLPGQPRHMRYARLGGVTAQALEVAANKLHAAGLSPALLNFMVDLPLWRSYLKRTFSGKFERLSLPFEQRMFAVFEQSLALSDAVYRTQMEQILREQVQAENAEVKRQTEDALKFDNLNLCQLR